MSFPPRIVPLAGPDELAALQAACAADNHPPLFAPTHAFKRGEQIVGGASLGAAVTNLFWFSQRDLSPRDSFSLINATENCLRLRGVRHVLVPVGPASPFNAVMAPLGFTDLGTWHLNCKTL